SYLRAHEISSSRRHPFDLRLAANAWGWHSRQGSGNTWPRQDRVRSCARDHALREPDTVVATPHIEYVSRDLYRVFGSRQGSRCGAYRFACRVVLGHILNLSLQLTLTHGETYFALWRGLPT